MFGFYSFFQQAANQISAAYQTAQPTCLLSENYPKGSWCNTCYDLGSCTLGSTLRATCTKKIEIQIQMLFIIMDVILL